MNIIKTFRRATLIALVAISTMTLVPTATVFAASTGRCPEVSGIIKCDSSQENPIMALLKSVVNFLSVGVGVVAVGGIAWGAVLYTTSNGDSGKTKQGVTVIVNTVIGLLLFVFAYAIMNFLVPGGLL